MLDVKIRQALFLIKNINNFKTKLVMEKILSIFTMLELIAIAMLFLSFIYILIRTRQFFAFFLAGMFGIIVVILAAIVGTLIDSRNTYAIIIMVYSVVAAGFFWKYEIE